MARIQGDPVVPVGVSTPKKNRTQNECSSSASDDATLAQPDFQSISSRVDKGSTKAQQALVDESPAYTVAQADTAVILASSETTAPESPRADDAPITSHNPDLEESTDSVISRADTVFSKSTTNSPSLYGASPFPSGEPSSPADRASRLLLSPSPYHTALRATKRGREEAAGEEDGNEGFDVEQEERAAVEQAAEDGNIIIDHDDMASDAGYESDANTTCSTSLAESIRDYVYENGRRYHRFREGRYNFPNDDVEYVFFFLILCRYQTSVEKICCGNVLTR